MQQDGGYGDSAGPAGTVTEHTGNPWSPVPTSQGHRGAWGTHAANWSEVMLREDSISESAGCMPRLCGLIMHNDRALVAAVTGRAELCGCAVCGSVRRVISTVCISWHRPTDRRPGPLHRMSSVVSDWVSHLAVYSWFVVLQSVTSLISMQ